MTELESEAEAEGAGGASNTAPGDEDRSVVIRRVGLAGVASIRLRDEQLQALALGDRRPSTSWLEDLQVLRHLAPGVDEVVARREDDMDITVPAGLVGDVDVEARAVVCFSVLLELQLDDPLVSVLDLGELQAPMGLGLREAIPGDVVEFRV